MYRAGSSRHKKGTPPHSPSPQTCPAHDLSLLRTPPSAIAKRRRASAPSCARKGTRLYTHLHLHRLHPPLSSLVVRLLDSSVDYVFDGTSPPYAPSALTNPLNLYGTSKRDAELGVLGVQGARVAVLRVPILCVFLFSSIGCIAS
jgi:hypothetical protein